MIKDSILFFKRIIKKYKNKNLHNLYNSNHQKRVLISYITKPFWKNSNIHSNYIEAVTIAKVFDDLGFVVDIVEYDTKLSKRFFVNNIYDVVFGFGDVFINAIYNNQNKNMVKISYATGAHNCFQNNAEILRIKGLYQRKGILLEPRRIINKPFSLYTHLSDAIFIIGNKKFTAQSFKEYTNTPSFCIRLPIFSLKHIYNRDYSIAKYNFLWFGSSGLVHKGLDLCLEVFSQYKNVHLHICSPREGDFFELYHKELFETSNIHYHGFIDIQTPQYKDIAELCAFSIFPSCSEGMSGSLLTTMASGLIPIATMQTGVDRINEYGYIIEGSVKSIDAIVNEVIQIDSQVLYDKSNKVAQYTKENFNKENFNKDFNFALKQALLEENK
jgi:hypothetical protein